MAAEVTPQFTSYFSGWEQQTSSITQRLDAARQRVIDLKATRFEDYPEHFSVVRGRKAPVRLLGGPRVRFAAPTQRLQIGFSAHTNELRPEDWRVRVLFDDLGLKEPQALDISLYTIQTRQNIPMYKSPVEPTFELKVAPQNLTDETLGVTFNEPEARNFFPHPKRLEVAVPDDRWYKDKARRIDYLFEVLSHGIVRGVHKASRGGDSDSFIHLPHLLYIDLLESTAGWLEHLVRVRTNPEKPPVTQ